MNTKSKLKATAVLQALASLGASLGTPVPTLANWGMEQQQLTSNLARAYEMQYQEEQRKKAKKKGVLGGLLGLLGVATGGLLSPLGAAVGGMLGSTIGQKLAGGELDLAQPIQFGIYGSQVGTQAYSSMPPKPTLAQKATSMINAISGIGQTTTANKLVLTKIGDTYILLDPETYTMSKIVSKLLEPEEEKKEEYND